MRRIRSKLSYANVTASLALFIALGGTSYAVTQLPANSVGPKQIRKGAVGKSELRRAAVTSRAIRDGGVAFDDIAPAARTALKGAKGDPGSPGVAYRAAINSGGIAVAGNAVAASHDGGSGFYTVAFDRDVSGCIATATLAAVANGPAVEQPPAGRITVGSEGPRIAVRTYDAAGAVRDLPFHLHVAC